MAVLPTPGSPINTGLFLVLLDNILIQCLISSSLPITGSIFPFLAASVKSLPYFSSILSLSSGLSVSTFLFPLMLFRLSLNFLKSILYFLKIASLSIFFSFNRAM